MRLSDLTTGNDRSTSESGRRGRRPASPLWATSGPEQLQHILVNNIGGMVRLKP